jgi:hypothetical protein
MPPVIRALPVGPLLDLIAHLDAPEAAAKLGVSDDSIRQWRSRGTTKLFVDRADQYAVRLGLHPALIWGDDWWSLPEVDES